MKLSAVLAAACFGALGNVAGASTLRGSGGDLGAGSQGGVLELPSLISGLEAADAAGAAAPISDATSGLENMLMRIESDPNSLKGVAGVVKPIVEQFLKQLENSHNKSLQAIADSVADITKCKPGNGTQTTAPSVAAVTQYVIAEKELKSCKTGLSSNKHFTGTCRSVIGLMKSNFDTKCKNLDDAPTQVAPGDSCQVVQSDNTGTWLERMATLWKKQYMEHLELMYSCGNLTAMIAGKEKECDAEQAKLKNASKTCGDSYDKVKQIVCSMKQALGQACSVLDTCYSRTVNTYQQLQNSTTVEIATRKNQYGMIKRLQCLVGAFDFSAGKVVKEKLDKCVGATYTTDHLNIAYPAVPSKQPCSRPPLPNTVDVDFAKSC